jgi:hypothetical protein
MAQTTTATNIQGPDLSNQAADANKSFNNYYSIPLDITSNVNDALVSFFQQQTNNATAAQMMAAAVTYTAMAQKISPMQVLDNFRKLSQGELTQYVAAFMNTTRVPTSAIGISQPRKTNSYVQRTLSLF